MDTRVSIDIFHMVLSISRKRPPSRLFGKSIYVHPSEFCQCYLISKSSQFTARTDSCIYVPIYVYMLKLCTALLPSSVSLWYLRWLLLALLKLFRTVTALKGNRLLGKLFVVIAADCPPHLALHRTVHVQEVHAPRQGMHFGSYRLALEHV